jgi:hypothetical protein
LPGWVVWTIYTKSVDVRNDIIYGITVWRLIKGKTSGENRENKRRREPT